jgi:hypothetical protein
MLLRRETYRLLGDVKLEDDEKSRMEKDLVFGEKPAAPTSEALSRTLELGEEVLERFRMTGASIPSLRDHLQKIRHGSPKVLKLEASGPPRAGYICKKERAMVGESGG